MAYLLDVSIDVYLLLTADLEILKNQFVNNGNYEQCIVDYCVCENIIVQLIVNWLKAINKRCYCLTVFDYISFYQKIITYSANNTFF